MGAIEAVNLIINDHGDKGSGFRMEFAEDMPYKSILQRQNMPLESMLNIFKWDGDSSLWVSEYKKDKPEMDKLARYRRRVCFDVGGWRELNEDFGRCDVSCLRDIRTPLVTSRSPLRVARDEFNE